MKYIIRSSKTENTEAIKEYIESKLSKLDKYFETSDDIEATVLTKVNGREKVIEVTIPTKHFSLISKQKKGNLPCNGKSVSLRFIHIKWIIASLSTFSILL